MNKNKKKVLNIIQKHDKNGVRFCNSNTNTCTCNYKIKKLLVTFNKIIIINSGFQKVNMHIKLQIIYKYRADKTLCQGRFNH